MKNGNEEIRLMLCGLNAHASRDALDALLPLVYDELHRQAHRYLRGERRNHTLQTTALINEAYLRLIGQTSIEWQNRAHFFALAANMMRRILVDYAKTKHRLNAVAAKRIYRLRMRSASQRRRLTKPSRLI